MSDSRVTPDGLEGVRPGREAPATYSTPRRGRRRRGGEQPTVPDAEFTSYYGKPVLNTPVWSPLDIPAYLYLGGLAGGSSLIAAAAALRGEHELSRATKLGATVSAGLSLAALVHDLGKPSRFLNMLRVFKVTSPMSVGSWLLAAYAPATAVAAGSDVTGRLRPLGKLATGTAAVLAPGVASYTAALISDTAVPTWHDGYRELPFVFVGSAAMASGGLGMLTAPASQQGLPRRLATLGTLAEFGAAQLMEHRLGLAREPYRRGKTSKLMWAGRVLGAAGLATGVLGRRSGVLSRAAGATLMVSTALTKFGIYHAGIDSSKDPKYTVVPQRERLEKGTATRQGKDASTQ